MALTADVGNNDLATRSDMALGGTDMAKGANDVDGRNSDTDKDKDEEADDSDSSDDDDFALMMEMEVGNQSLCVFKYSFLPFLCFIFCYFLSIDVQYWRSH